MTYHRIENQERGRRASDRKDDNQNPRNRGARGQRDSSYERDRMANEGGWQRERKFEPERRFGGWQQSDLQSEGSRLSRRWPKGWQRSDERVLEVVNQALADHSDIDASEIEVTCQSGEIVLRGSVRDRHTKRLAEAVVENLPDVKDVRNELRVTPA